MILGVLSSGTRDLVTICEMNDLGLVCPAVKVRGAKTDGPTGWLRCVLSGRAVVIMRLKLILLMTSRLTLSWGVLWLSVMDLNRVVNATCLVNGWRVLWTGLVTFAAPSSTEVSLLNIRYL